VKILVGYSQLRPEVRAALDRHADGCDVIYHDCSASNEAYHEFLDEHWQIGLDLVVIEHDIVIDERVIPEFQACPKPWCGFGYEVGVGYGVYLGCTRFRRQLLDAVPDAFDLVQQERQSGVPPKAWYRLDVRLDAVLREHDFEPHLHMPPVRHLNDVSKLADPIPVYAAGKDV